MWQYQVDEMFARLARIERNIQFLMRAAIHADTKEILQMATLQDIIAEVSRTRGITSSIKVAVDLLKAKIAELTAALEAAIAANDPVATQAVVDELKAVNDELDALAPAIVANPA